MDFEISVYFLLTGKELDPQTITDKLGIAPTKTFRAGELIQPKASPQWRQNGWLLESKLHKSAELEEHIEFILEKLQPGWNILKELGQIYEAAFDCVVYVYEYVPALCWEKNIVKKVAELNARIDVDLIYSTVGSE